MLDVPCPRVRRVSASKAGVVCAIERTSALANGAAGLFPSPALTERCHRSLAPNWVRDCWCPRGPAVCVQPNTARPL